MKHTTTNTIKQGKKSGMRITTTIDDEAQTKTHDVYSWRGKRTTKQHIVWNTATGKLLTVNHSPVSDDESIYTVMTRTAAELISSIADKAQATEPEKT